MKNKLFSFIVLAIIVIGAILVSRYTEPNHVERNQDEQSVNSLSYYYPTVNGELIEHEYYSLSYIDENEQAEWVIHFLTAESVNGEASRDKLKFREDPLVTTRSAKNSDYTALNRKMKEKYGSDAHQFDRGHLCPAADMKINQQAMTETFYCSNACPQYNFFNTKTWNNLEYKIRQCVHVCDTIIVVTGPVFGRATEYVRLDDKDVPVATAFYKVLYAPKENLMQAFIVEHQPSGPTTCDCQKCSISVDSLETLTGINFFPNLPAEIEHELESQNNYSKWKSTFKY